MIQFACLVTEENSNEIDMKMCFINYYSHKNYKIDTEKSRKLS